MLTKFQAAELIHGQTLHYARQTECIKVRSYQAVAKHGKRAPIISVYQSSTAYMSPAPSNSGTLATITKQPTTHYQESN